MTSNAKTRVVESIGDPGRWVAQYFDTAIQQWFDIGDSKATADEAKENRLRYLADLIHKAAPGDDEDHCGVCGQRIDRVPGGQGLTYVHSDSRAVAAPNPPSIVPPTPSP